MSNRATADHTPDAATFRDTEIDPIPADWDVIPFPKTLRSVRPKVGKVQQRDYRSYGCYPVVDQSQTHIAGYTDDASLVYEGDLPVVIFGDHTRIFKFVDFKFVCGADGVKVLVPNTDIIEPTYYYFALSSLTIPNKGYNRHYKLLQEQPIPLPPLEEQRRIAAVLTAIQDAIAAQEDVIAAARTFKRSLMHRLFTYGPGREPSATKETLFGDVPQMWDSRPLSECAIVQTGTTKGRRFKATDDVVSVPYLRVANVQDGYLDLSEIKEVKVRRQDIDRYRLEVGDVLMTEGGDFDKLGRGFIWQGEVENCIHQNHVFAVRTHRELLRPDFLTYLAQSPYGKSYFLSVAHRTTNLASINSTKLKALPVLLPDLSVQTAIVEMMTSTDDKIAAEEDRLSALQALFKSMLHQLMTGQIRLLSDEGISHQRSVTDD